MKNEKTKTVQNGIPFLNRLIDLELIEDNNRWERVYFALFSKSGFTPELEHKAGESNKIFLYDFSTT